jgi:hypothetical protein
MEGAGGSPSGRLRLARPPPPPGAAVASHGPLSSRKELDLSGCRVGKSTTQQTLCGELNPRVAHVTLTIDGNTPLPWELDPGRSAGNANEPQPKNQTSRWGNQHPQHWKHIDLLLQHPSETSKLRGTHAYNMHQKPTARHVSSALPSPTHRPDAAGATSSSSTCGAEGATMRSATGAAAGAARGGWRQVKYGRNCRVEHGRLPGQNRDLAIGGRRWWEKNRGIHQN